MPYLAVSTLCHKAVAIITFSANFDKGIEYRTSQYQRCSADFRHTFNNFEEGW